MIQRADIIGRFLLAALLWVAGLATAHAQSSYTNTTAGAIGAGTACGTTDLTRTFNVTDTFNIGDVRLGLIADHSWRGDIRLDLQAPSGNQFRLVNEDTSANGNINNYNIELADDGDSVINTPPHDTDDTVPGSFPVTSFENNVIPNNDLMSSFDAEPANGTWTLILCDAEPNFDDGQFHQATLTVFPDTPPTDADLSLNVSASNNTPEFGSQVTLTFDLANAGPLDATNTAAQITLPAGLSYVSHTGGGNYVPGTGVWTNDPVTNGTSSVLTIVATVEPTGGYNVSAEVTASDQPDPDSTPNNGVTTEDDYDALTLVPTTSTTPPPLACPIAQQFTHDWEAPGATNGWPLGTLTNSYTAGGEPLDFAFSGNTNRFLPRNGVTIPATTTEFDDPAYGLVMFVDYEATSEQVTLAIDLGTAGTGVGALQFKLSDIDLGAWTDEITVTGSLGGTSIFPVLTPGVSNTVSGNVITGTAGVPSDSPNGDAFVTFNSPIDQVTLIYGNSAAQTNPARQVIALEKLDMCPAMQAKVTAAKTVEMSDPNQHAVPGAEILYTITINNDATATAAADNIDLSDTLPDNVRFVSATPAGFTGGSFNAPALPAANTDCDSGACVIHFDGATLAIGATGEIEIRAVLK